jgi:SAM-dependent methyltransferase
MSHLLEEAEELERGSAESRVAYFTALFRKRRSAPLSLLDAGCGNGHSVLRWRAEGVRAIGVDSSLYRMSRWAALHGDSSPMVVADAARLPFAAGTFDAVTSSGMIEHVGVTETSQPYTVAAHADQDAARSSVVAELARVTSPNGLLVIDCPNGSFPIDFWHGDALGSVRFHRIPDALLPGHAQLLAWGRSSGMRPRLEPLRERLRFRQISRRWWGRLLSPLVRGVLAGLDLVVGTRAGPVVAWVYPYVVVSYEKSPPRADSGAV